MAWVAPRTWVVGELVTAAMMNQDIRDNSTFLNSRWNWIAAPAAQMTDSSRDVTLDWTDLDLTSVTSATTVMVYLELYMRTGTIGAGDTAYLGVRKNGETPGGYPRLSVSDYAANNDLFYAHVLCGCDADEIVEYTINIVDSSGTISITTIIRTLAYMEAG